jgi:hypothetical protein
MVVVTYRRTYAKNVSMIGRYWCDPKFAPVVGLKIKEVKLHLDFVVDTVIKVEPGERGFNPNEYLPP